MKKKIIFSAGGTGGHILPAINLMKHFSEKGYDVALATDSRGKRYIDRYSDFKFYIINTATTTNKSYYKKFISIFAIFYSILKSFKIIKLEKPDLVFGLGGYASFPLCFTSKLINLPLFIYENNMVLGRANRYLSFFAKKILISNPNIKRISKKYKSKVNQVGPVINKNIINSSKDERIFDNEYFTILVLGGSQGAEVFGEIIPTVIKMIETKGYKININQQCTDNQKKTISDFYKKNKINNNVFEFDKDIYKLILSSNLAVTRCGASTTAELVYANTPFIAVPLPNSIDDHQYLNAKYYEEKGCCWLLKQNNFNIENLFNLIIEIIKNKSKLKKTYINMKKNNDKNIYNNIENLIKNFI